jgi:hypothetical protein
VGKADRDKTRRRGLKLEASVVVRDEDFAVEDVARGLVEVA